MGGHGNSGLRTAILSEDSRARPSGVAPCRSGSVSVHFSSKNELTPPVLRHHRSSHSTYLSQSSVRGQNTTWPRHQEVHPLSGRLRLLRRCSRSSPDATPVGQYL